MDSECFLLEDQDQSEFYADSQFSPSFIDLSMPAEHPGSLLHSPEHKSQKVSTRPGSQSVETFQDFSNSAHSLRMKHAQNCDYSTVLVSSGKCGVDIKCTQDMDLHSVDCVNNVKQKQESSAEKFPQNHAHGAVQRCAANEKRLVRINELLDSLAEGAWSTPDDLQTMQGNLKLNKYYPMIRLKMLKSRLMHHELQPITDGIDSAAADPDLYENASKCGEEICDEVSSLRMLEEQALDAVQAMMASMSADIPLCAEESQAILSRVKALFNPARRALSARVKRLAAEKDSHSRIAR